MEEIKDETVLKEIAEIRKKLLTFRRNANPMIAEIVTVQITIAPDAEPGRREVRLQAAAGISNPVTFHVGQFAEFNKKDANAIQESAAGKPRRNLQPGAAPPSPEMTITLPATVNGQILPSNVDHYRFQARKGQQLVVCVHARALIPYLADAVPGWFQAAVAIHDARGNELAYDDHYRFDPDPVISCKIPADGEYVLEIKDSLYRGREDFVYRITVGELPFITSIFPLGGPAGAQTGVKLEGWNLPRATLTVDARDKKPGTLFLSVRGESETRRQGDKETGRQGDKETTEDRSILHPPSSILLSAISNRVPFAVDALPECLEQEPNNDAATAQRVTLPIIVNGRIDKPGDCDVFRFDGRASQEIVAEVMARRLDSPLDSVLRLTDAAGKQLAFNDDHADKVPGCTPTTPIPCSRATCPPTALIICT